ncbi:hypothetical protein [Saccharibacillus kuerlensis]|uniref:Uncharacterized protein n=1 Tax=Saccharibacillus kuerlensis TaxID=459527 RepID=A0ABQ2KYM1_9BACL|nr:hypothetical protein [Saccharibacillus kuerlensis]GGN96767.1 hypothetical protein GCM10010969_14040 [Saccharibacillus kuerlensis]
MPPFLEWIMNNLFIVVIIAGALLSVFSKKGAKPPGGGGEPFGGRGASNGNPAQRRVSEPRPEPVQRRAVEQRPEPARRSPFSEVPTSAETGRAPSRPLADARASRQKRNSPSTLAEASQRMNEEIERRLNNHKSHQHQSDQGGLERMEPKKAKGSGNANSKAAQAYDIRPAQTFTGSDLSNPTSEELRKAVLWTEVLGAPRSRKPFPSGRR